MDWKKVLSKLHLSLSAVVLAIAGFFLFIAAPIQYYDQWVVRSGEECAVRVRNAYFEKAITKEMKSGKFKPIKLDDGTRDNWSDFIDLNTGIPVILPVEESNGLNDTTIKECRVSVWWIRDLEKWRYQFHRVLYDEEPDPASMLKAGFFFIGLALLLFALKKWTIWLAS